MDTITTSALLSLSTDAPHSPDHMAIMLGTRQLAEVGKESDGTWTMFTKNMFTRMFTNVGTTDTDPIAALASLQEWAEEIVEDERLYAESRAAYTADRQARGLGLNGW